jgi:hypothetical protein
VTLLLTMAPMVGVMARMAAVGEIDSFASEQQLAAEIVHGPLSESLVNYKVQRVIALRPDILIVGSSRVLRWRVSLFDGCAGRLTCAYNAGGTMGTMLEADQVVRRVTEGYSPKVMILDVAHWNFDPNHPDNTHQLEDIDPSAPARLRAAAANVREVVGRALEDARIRSVLLGGVSAPAGYRGIRAISRGEGFLQDGAYWPGIGIAETEAIPGPQRSADAIRAVDASGPRFNWFDRADDRDLGELEDLLTVAADRHIKVIALMTPYSDDVADEVQAQPGLRGGFADVEAKLDALFARRGIPFVRYRRLSEIGCTPEEALDGFHPGEVCSARLLRALLGVPEIRTTLAPYVTATHLDDVIAHRHSSLLLEPPP